MVFPTEMMVLTEKERNIKKTLLIVALVSFAVFYSIYSWVILPRYIASLYNIVYENSAVPDVLNYSADAFEMMGLAVFYGVLCYGMYCLGHKKMRSMIFLFVGANLYKYTSNMIMTWIDGGKVPLDFGFDIINAIYYTATEMLTFVIVWFICKGIINSYLSKQASLEKNGKAESAVPFSGIYQKGNCLMKSALMCSLVMFGLKFVFQLINDLVTVEEVVNVGLMIVSYASNVIFGIICYFVMLFTMMTLGEKLN